MAKKSRSQRHANRYRPGHSYAAHRELARINSVLREPVIRITDYRRRYNDRLNQHNVLVRKQNYQRFLETHAPKRAMRKSRNEIIKRTLGKEIYHQIHDCKREFSKLLSWRSSQGGGGRKRSRKELRNNRTSFLKRDC